MELEKSLIAGGIGMILLLIFMIAYYKVPGFVASVAELPLTSTQKIQRSELKALVDRLVGDPATVDTTALKRRRSGS